MIKGDNILSVGTPAGGGISIISADPVTSGGGGGGDNPPITDNLSLLLRPDVDVYSDAGVTPAVADDNIRQMNDQSVTGNILTQTTAISQPILKEGIFGTGIMSIQAVNDWLNFSIDVDVPNTQNSWTLYMTYKKATAHDIFGALKLNGTNGRTEWISNEHQVKDINGSARDIIYSETDTNPRIVTYTLDRSANEFKMYINGSYIGKETSSSVVNWPVKFDRVYAHSTRTVNYGDILSYDATHDSTQVAQVADWINGRYQIY